MKKNNILLLVSLLVIGTIIFIYFYFNNSYTLSFSAKIDLHNEKYQQAYEKAKQAYTLDHYNRMAFTVLNQASESLKWIDYIDETEGYLEKIAAISEKTYVKNDQLMRIKLMCDISNQRYQKLYDSNMLQNQKLQEHAKQLNEKMQRIYSKLF
jgi:RimJ/RimL family protein N-acetyltransferase